MPYLVAGDSGAPLVPALLACGVDVTCHAPSADIVVAGNAAMPGRFTQGAPNDCVYGGADQANVVFIKALDACGVARLRAVLARCRPAVQGVLIVADDEARQASDAPAPHDRVWWEARCFEAGFRRHPCSHQLRDAQQLGGLGQGVIILCEPVPPMFSRAHPVPKGESKRRCATS